MFSHLSRSGRLLRRRSSLFRSRRFRLSNVRQLRTRESILIHTDIFRVKLFVRGSGARFEGPRDIMSLEAFYQERMTEDTHVG